MLEILFALIIIIIIYLVYTGKMENPLIKLFPAQSESFAGSYTEGELRCISHGGRCPQMPGYNY